MLSALPALLSAAPAAPGPAASAVAPTTSDTPDFGPNVHVFDPATPVATIQAALDDAFEAQRLSPTAQFGPQRHAFLFKPGRYDVVARVGYYTALQGLGLGPDDVRITGNVLADSGWNLHDKGNALINFWRSVENLAIAPAGGSTTWAVSQAAPMRRVHVLGQLRVSPSNDGQPGQGYSSGGYLADSRIDGAVATGGQQQWYTRDSAVGGWSGKGWNTVFSGVRGAPATSFPQPPVTTLATTPRSREKPWLYLDATGKYRVFLPALRRDATGPSWSARHASPGRSIPLHRFFVARPGDTAATLNAALAQGLDLLFTPGVYPLAQTLRVTRAGTVVLGLGFPTLQPVDGITPMTVADVDGVRLAGLLFDAGSTNSDVLLAIGTRGSAVRHDADPISVQDVFFRIGGAVAGGPRPAWSSMPTTPSSTTCGPGAPTMETSSRAGRSTPPTPASSSMARACSPPACSSSISASTRWCGTARTAARSSSRTRCLTTSPTRPAGRAATARAGPPTRWGPTCAGTRRGAWAATATSRSTTGTRTSWRRAPSRRPRRPACACTASSPSRWGATAPSGTSSTTPDRRPKRPARPP
ncbi:MAG: hypothetical protein ACJ8G1_10460 [Vitreoscilla sp.]